MTTDITTNNTSLIRTALYEEHKMLGAKFTGFGGFEMPVYYQGGALGIINEHLAVRQRVGVFDISHMGELFLFGAGAPSFIEYVASNSFAKLRDGFAKYTLLLNARGGVVDDVIFYRLSGNPSAGKLSSDAFLICVNASNTQKVFEHLQELLAEWQAGRAEEVRLVNASRHYGLIAVQGPRACDVIQACTIQSSAIQSSANPTGTWRFLSFPDVGAQPSFSFQEGVLSSAGDGVDSFCQPLVVHQPSEGFVETGILPRGRVMLARTGYTGEDGFEIFCHTDDCVGIWQRLMAVGREFGIVPVGLGARDTLRLEAALPLYGHELGDDIVASASNVRWAIKMAKPEFVGKEAIVAHAAQHSDASALKLVGLDVKSAGILRDGASILDTRGNKVGYVTSGTFSPTLKRAIALAYVQEQVVVGGEKILAEQRGKKLEVEIATLPFYRRVNL